MDILLQILTIIGALALFIYGMKVMSEGIQKVAGSRLRSILRSMTKNRFIGVLAGFLITALVQSSSATTVLTVSFVNAGLLSLIESAGIMMGANVGTTITGWLIAIIEYFLGEEQSSFQFISFTLPLFALALPLLFVKKSNSQAWGETIIGFALLFIGLEELRGSLPNVEQHPEWLEIIATYKDMGLLSRVLFIGIGTVIATLLQSSSAAMALTLMMASKSLIPFDIAAAMILGENIGTTITAELAAWIGNSHAKQSARIHSLFNLFGVGWMFFLLPIYLTGIDNFMLLIGKPSPFVDVNSIPFGLAFFHTAFNITNLFLLLGFVPVLVEVAKRTVPTNGKKEDYSLTYIKGGIIANAELSIGEARKEIYHFGKLVLKMGYNTLSLLNGEAKKPHKLIEKIKEREETTDVLEIKIADFLAKVSENGLSQKGSIRVRSLFSIINELERIADAFYESSILYQKMDKAFDFRLPIEIQKELSDLLEAVQHAFNHALSHIDDKSTSINIEQVYQFDKHINQEYIDLVQNYYDRLEKQQYSPRRGILLLQYIHNLEKIGDHIVNIGEAIKGIK